VVLDNEAGLENLSRRIVQKVDTLIIAADPSQRGLETVNRLYALAQEMEMKYDRLAIIVNRLRRDDLPSQVPGLKTITGADIVMGLPESAELAEFNENGKSIRSLSPGNPVSEKINEFLVNIGLGQ
jgi:CO dehydrogenase maturation factor